MKHDDDLSGPARQLVFGAAMLVIAAICGRARAEETLAVLPPEPVLTGPHARQRLVVELVRDGQLAGDVTAQARLSLSDPNVAAIDDKGVVTPRADGVAELRAEYEGKVASTRLVVRLAQTAEPWSFRHDVQTVLTPVATPAPAMGRKPERGASSWRCAVTTTRWITTRSPGRPRDAALCPARQSAACCC